MSKKIHIVDYGIGNLFSVAGALYKIGMEPVLIDKPEDVGDADFLILPGVGAFQKGMSELTKRGFDGAVVEYALRGKPLLGICVGMQILFESSEENGYASGLGLMHGHIKKLSAEREKMKIPHIGWSQLQTDDGARLSFVDKQYMYFVHSYYPVTDVVNCVARTTYQGVNMAAIVNVGNIWGCQFHPEKSGTSGLALLKNLIDSSL